MRLLNLLLFSMFLATALLGQPARVAVTGSLSPFFLPAQANSIRIGTFSPSFDPFTYKYEFGIDQVGNMDSPNYTRAVGTGVFRELGGGQFSGFTFNRTVSVAQAAGQQIWVFVFDHPNPDEASLFALFTGSGPEWLTPATGLVTLSANSADTFVFGSGGRGGPIEVQILPIPEPGVKALISTGFFAACIGVCIQRQNGSSKVPLRQRAAG